MKHKKNLSKKDLKFINYRRDYMTKQRSQKKSPSLDTQNKISIICKDGNNETKNPKIEVKRTYRKSNRGKT